MVNLTGNEYVGLYSAGGVGKYFGRIAMADTQSKQWYVIFCKPHQENQVCHYLGIKGFETYYPTYRVQHDNSRSPKVKPFFPRYLFVRADLDETATSVLNWIPGAVGLVTYGDTPASVPQHIVNELKDRSLERDTNARSPCRRMRRGEPVRILQPTKRSRSCPIRPVSSVGATKNSLRVLRGST